MNTKKTGAGTILCVEDEELQLQLRKALFESAGYRVLLAANGQQALDLFRANSVDAVVIDYWLAGMDGVVVAREMKNLRPAVPVLVLSGSSSLPDESIDFIDRWIQKAQIEPEDLLEYVNRLIHGDA
jgi:CheY-like chemotaxis protein